MSDLTTRLQLIEDRNAIADLEADYAAHWDFGRAQGWAEVFTPGGVFEMLPAGSLQPFKAVGHAELQAFCETILKNWKGMHFMHPPRLTLRGDQASALIFFEYRHVMRQDNGHTRQGVVAGYYHVDYLRTAQGWRMEHRREQAMFDDTTDSFDLYQDPGRA